MSLSPFLRYVYNHGSGQVITRGKKIFFARGVSLLDVDYQLEQVRFRVKNDVYNNQYTVTVSKFLQPEKMSLRCGCPYNLGEICRHEVAAVFHLNDLIQSGFFEHTEVKFDQKHTVARMRDINPVLLRLFTDDDMMERAAAGAEQEVCAIVSARNEKVVANVLIDKKNHEVTIVQNEDRYFDTACKCAETRYPLCIHKLTLFLQLYNAGGAQYFRGLQNWDEQKNKLLRLYGYSLNDNLDGKFEFVYQDGKPILRVLDASIKKVGAVAAVPAVSVPEEEEPEAPLEQFDLGLVLDLKTEDYPHCALVPVSGEADEKKSKFVGPIDRMPIHRFVNLDVFSDNEREWINLARKTTPEEIVKFIKRSLPFGDFLGDEKEILRDEPQPELIPAIWEYLLPKYKGLLSKSEGASLCFLHRGPAALSAKTLVPITLSAAPLTPVLEVLRQEKKYKVRLGFSGGGETFAFEKENAVNAALVLHEQTVYCLDNVEQVMLVEAFLPFGSMDVDSKKWNDFLSEKLVPWKRIADIRFPEEMVTVLPAVKPHFRLYVYEQGETFQMRPGFVYNGIEAKMGDAVELINAKDGRIELMERDTVTETEFCNMVQGLHEQMMFGMREKQFFIQAKNALRGNWFAQFHEKMDEWNVEVFGYDQLKNLRVNRNIPKADIRISSNIDWFETSVEIAFGDQTVNISEVKKALQRKENFVKLPDGTVGILPEQMLQKFTLLTKMGEVENGKLKVKKIHFAILDELMGDVDEEALQDELEQKKQQLDKIIDNDYSAVQAPENLKAVLRPYQLVGFRWLMFLKEAGWGGILADDMGLGKTVQTLSWLAHCKAENPAARFLVVCPTTLTYNWEKEIEKFVPHFKKLIHHGPKRTLNFDAFGEYDIIITSYGTLRSDIKKFAELEFDYVVLDESQAIKNPKSLITKAVSALKAKNRLALSGTPVQNNTFDLYAQMNFLNPGMLGSRDFFMNEFAVPIDKFQEKEAKEQLRKLVYPFMLRRTKAQVAQDLPDKTETVLYCEMDKEQRKIYESYRSNYQSKILGMIDEQGLQRSRFHILQGLTRLRQICDSPAILKDDEPYENHSVKLEELTRELQENTGEHKALVFSQFLGMLGLIRKALEEKGIPYVYFDGSTASADRERAIKQFQEQDECKVFLISLKAGGVGLNLTAADYVYIVDPWWNPAVEQQAIDRTHRIGQTKNVFAYRFICKDTIEEKMLILQERKRLLAEDLVADDNAIMKRLTREDIAFLFS